MKIMFIIKETKKLRVSVIYLSRIRVLKRDPCVNSALNHAGDHFVRVYIEVG